MQSIHDRIVMMIIIAMAASLTSFWLLQRSNPNRLALTLGSSLWFKIKSSVFSNILPPRL